MSRVDESKTIVLQVVLPPHVELEEYERETIAEALILETENYLNLNTRVVFFNHGSAVYGMVEE